MHVAVIGAGASGLLSAREALLQGCQVTVFEQLPGIGGIWRTSNGWDRSGVEDTTNRHVHASPVSGVTPVQSGLCSPIWPGMLTNGPREALGAVSLPFLPEFMHGRSTDPAQFCSHTEELAYLEAYADEYELRPHIRFSTHVVSVVRTPESPEPLPFGEIPERHELIRWRISSSPIEAMETTTVEDFDAVLICVGHASIPHIPEIPGAAAFQGLQMHSLAYRSADLFEGKSVLVIGAHPSGIEIGSLVAAVAKKVYISARQWPSDGWKEPKGELQNINLIPEVAGIGADGSVELGDGNCVGKVDCIIYCTGYCYSTPFLQGEPSIVNHGRWLSGLYHDVWSPAIGPSLGFIGIANLAGSVSRAELCAKWAARVMVGAAALPLPAKMQAELAQEYAKLEEMNIPEHQVHFGHSSSNIWAENDFICDSAGIPRLHRWRKEILEKLVRIMISWKGNFREANYSLPGIDVQAEYIAEYRSWLAFEEKEAEQRRMKTGEL